MVAFKGKRTFLDDELTVATFFPRRVTAYFQSAKDLDGIKKTFKLELRHFNCLRSRAVRRLFVWEIPEGEDVPLHLEEWADHVYFHPNVRMDGRDIVWTRFVELNTKTDNSWPLCPHSPKFWQHPIQGSAIFCWPPSSFEAWVKVVAEGGTLAVDPAPLPVAGPSGTSHTPDPSLTAAPSPSHSSHPPPSSHDDWEMLSSSGEESDLPGLQAVLQVKKEMAEAAQLGFLPSVDDQGMCTQCSATH